MTSPDLGIEPTTWGHRGVVDAALRLLETEQVSRGWLLAWFRSYLRLSVHVSTGTAAEQQAAFDEAVRGLPLDKLDWGGGDVLLPGDEG